MFGWRKYAVFALGTLLLAGIWAVSPTLRTASPEKLHSVPDSLPARLTDAEFWMMVEDFSEPNGFFRSDNLLSNEAGLQTAIPKLKERVKPGGVYIGVGPEQNFTYILNLEPKLSFIVDIRRMNMLEHLLYKALFELSTDRADFLSRLFSRKRPKGLREDTSIEAIFDAYETAPADKTFFERNLSEVLVHLRQNHQFRLTREDDDQIRYVYTAFFRSGPNLSYTFNDSYYQGTLGMPTYRELMLDTDGNEDHPRNLGFLGTEERFRHLQAVQRKNLIVPLVGDFAGPKTLKSVARYLKEHDAMLSAFYTSNVEMYLFQEGDDWKRFYENVADIPSNAASTFIRFTIGRRRFFAPDGILAQRSQMWSPVQEILAAVRAREIADYPGVIEMSSW
jgi:hypothetical protein